LNFDPLPQFSPENFAILRCRRSERRKQFHRGLTQLLEEGAIQAFTDSSAARRELLLAAVGELQFDVVRFRLESEYDTATDIEWLPFKLARWTRDDPDRLRGLRLPYSAKLVRDQVGYPAVLFRSKWDAEYAERENPEMRFSAVRMSASPRNSHRHPSHA
jgi:peptide chain release factor 3